MGFEQLQLYYKNCEGRLYETNFNPVTTDGELERYVCNS